MGRPAAQPKSSLSVVRGLERSRLEKYLIAAAYELVVPILRRSLAPPASADQRETDGVHRDEVQSSRGERTA
jgi:hypothetical protein